VFNLYWLWILGTVVERAFGHAKTALLLAFFAIGSNSLDFAFDRSGVGLSGVGYGLFGLLWILSERDERFKGAIDKRTVDLFISWFFICIVTTLTHIFVVANVAHARAPYSVSSSDLLLRIRRAVSLTARAHSRWYFSDCGAPRSVVPW
jgi:GlpG protein